MKKCKKSPSSLDELKARWDISKKKLLNTAPCIGPSITNLFDQFLTAGKIPSQWKISTVVPIPKSDNYNSPTNYRPILFLSTQISLPWSRLYSQSWIVAISDVTVPLPSVKPHCLFESGQCSLRYSSITWWMCRSNSLLRIIFFDHKSFWQCPTWTAYWYKVHSIGLNEHILCWTRKYLSDCNKLLWMAVSHKLYQ